MHACYTPHTTPHAHHVHTTRTPHAHHTHTTRTPLAHLIRTPHPHHTYVRASVVPFHSRRLLLAEELRKPVFTFTLLGFDIGAAVAVKFAELFPRVVRTICAATVPRTQTRTDACVYRMFCVCVLCVCVLVYVCVQYVFACLCVYVYVLVYVCVCVCTHVHDRWTVSFSSPLKAYPHLVHVGVCNYDKR